jgi:hypothetical protein
MLQYEVYINLHGRKVKKDFLTQRYIEAKISGVLQDPDALLVASLLLLGADLLG